MTSNQQIKPDYGLAQSVAYETVQTCNQKKLPLSIKKLIKSIPNLHIQKYSKFAKARNLSIEETFELLDSEEGCLWMRSDGQYIILYNDAVDNTGRIRFTLAHELGHYLLKHNEKTKKTLLARYSLTNEEYDVFEKEANYFAKRLLAPIPLVDLYVASWSRIYPECIEFAFDTSYTVANYIINDLHRRQRNANVVSEGHPLTYNFIDYINVDSSSQICRNCHSPQPAIHKFCAFCGSNEMIKSTAKNYTNYFLERKNVMIYSKIETNEHGTPIKCPRCSAEECSNDFDYCPYCAAYLHNVCLGGKNNQYYEDSYGNMIERTLKEQFEDPESCSGYLDGGFRYCPTCGSETSYLRQNFLDDWKTERDKKNDPFLKAKFEKLPF
ncbi:ImmA/IrrE family metallo-endopeptidase [Enterococcus avium]|uniref:ImmA/IrrE family metallo-endopeptidase n=1 Tax=Enterococcus avium TaxID=33945 RepID=UPI00288F1657|nr:ImmA/IrrE family metallo-endopeptidase [Enterococcus avium]MDT2500300.1 ImmA/IrrE family metallo-endopeptidase [Enterococcus avium]